MDNLEKSVQYISNIGYYTGKAVECYAFINELFASRDSGVISQEAFEHFYELVNANVHTYESKLKELKANNPIEK